MKVKTPISVIIANCIVICITVSAIADEGESIIAVDGLSVPCSNCRELESGKCEIVHQDTALLVRCDEALDLLLPELVTKAAFESVNPNELLGYLSRVDKERVSTYAALQILLSSPTGEVLLRQNARSLSTIYHAFLADLVVLGFGSEETWKEFWNVVRIEDAEESIKLLATIAAAYPSINLDEIVTQLTIVDSGRDIQTLTVFGEAFVNANRSEAKIFTDVVDRLERCFPPRRSEEVLQNLVVLTCVENFINELPDEFKKYLNRVEVSYVTGWLKDVKPGPLIVIEYLARITTAEYITPTIHQLAEEAVAQIRKSSSIDNIQRLLHPDNAKLWEIIAPYNPIVAEQVAEMQVTFATQSFNEGNLNQSLKLIKQSFELVPAKRISNRVRVLKSFINNAAAFSKEDIAIIDELLARESKTTIPFWIRIILGVVCGFGVFLIITCVRVKRARSDIEAITESNETKSLSWRERKELQSLMKCFSLSSTSTEEELTKAYKVLVKDHHPDAGGAADEFVALSEKYQRAKQLLAQR